MASKLSNITQRYPTVNPAWLFYALAKAGGYGGGPSAGEKALSPVTGGAAAKAISDAFSGSDKTKYTQLLAAIAVQQKRRYLKADQIVADRQAKRLADRRAQAAVSLQTGQNGRRSLLYGGSSDLQRNLLA